MLFKSKYFQIVDLPIPATVISGNVDTNFQQQPQLQSITGDKRIFVKAIEAYTSADLLKSPLSNNPVASGVDLTNAVLTLRCKGTDLIKQIPLARLRPLTSGTPSNFFQWLLKDQYEIDWVNSRVTTLVTPGTSGTTTPIFSYVFGVHYDYNPDPIDLNPTVFNVFTTK
jgi:hypothetical protein